MSLILKVVWETADATSLDLHEKKRNRKATSIDLLYGGKLRIHIFNEKNKTEFLAQIKKPKQQAWDGAHVMSVDLFISWSLISDNDRFR